MQWPGGNLRGGLEQENIGFRLLKFLEQPAEPSVQKQGFANCIQLLFPPGGMHSSSHTRNSSPFWQRCRSSDSPSPVPPPTSSYKSSLGNKKGLWWHWFLCGIIWVEPKWGKGSKWGFEWAVAGLSALCVLGVFTSLADFACSEGRDCRTKLPGALQKSEHAGLDEHRQDSTNKFAQKVLRRTDHSCRGGFPKMYRG